METATIGIILSILSATGTAIWTFWTWNEQHQEEKEDRKQQIDALYVNPFLVAAEELRSRIYGILKEQELEFFQQKYPEKHEIGSPEAIEILYVLVKYFGWYWSVYRYGPYSRDKKAIELIFKIAKIFTNRKDFEGDAFYFSFSEQESLGQTFVKIPGKSEQESLGQNLVKIPGQIHSINREFESVTLYEFAEKIKESFKKERPLYQNISKTIEAIDRANNVEELEGRTRLMAVHNCLVELIDYLEEEEGFSISHKLRRKAHCEEIIPQQSEIEIVHSIGGRLRLRIPRLHLDKSYSEGLRLLIQALADVEEMKINLEAASVTIEYNSSIPESEFQQRIFQAIEKDKKTVDKNL